MYAVSPTTTALAYPERVAFGFDAPAVPRRISRVAASDRNG
jgi:hypothetical protein